MTFFSLSRTLLPFLGHTLTPCACSYFHYPPPRAPGTAHLEGMHGVLITSASSQAAKMMNGVMNCVRSRTACLLSLLPTSAGLVEYPTVYFKNSSASAVQHPYTSCLPVVLLFCPEVGMCVSFRVCHCHVLTAGDNKSVVERMSSFLATLWISCF